MRTSGPPAATLEARDLTRPDLRRSLVNLARRIAPAHEAEDIVQESLVDALTTRSGPRDRAHLEAWLRAIVRHRVSDYYRRTGREQAGAVPEGQVEPDEGSERELLRWAEEALPGGRADQQTFEWLLEEADGEHLETIARREQMPSDRVRQRVTRLRRHLRERWALELAAVVGVLFLVGYGVWARLRPAPIEASRDLTPQAVEPGLAPALRAQRLRNTALERCHAADHRACLDGLDEAARLDPAGDRSEIVQMARREAEKALTPPPVPAPSASGAGLPGATRFGRVTSGPRPASDTAPSAPHRCVCPKGDPLCSCF